MISMYHIYAASCSSALKCAKAHCDDWNSSLAAFGYLSIILFIITELILFRFYLVSGTTYWYFNFDCLSMLIYGSELINVGKYITQFQKCAVSDAKIDILPVF